MKYSRNPCVYIDIGGSSVRAIRKSTSERLVQSLDPNACLLDPIRQHRFRAVKKLSQKIRLYSKGRARETDSLNTRNRAQFQETSSRMSMRSTCRPSSAVSRTICRIGWAVASTSKMGTFKWLLKGLAKAESNKNNWHIPLPREQRCHHRMIKYHIYVHYSHTEKHN